MRRKDREVTDKQAVYEIIESCLCCRLGFNDDGEVYIVPLNFGYEEDGGHLVFYFHGAKEGRKFDLIKKEPHVGFEMDTAHEIYSKSDGRTACTYTARFKSIVGTGKVSLCEPALKRHGLTLIMKHMTQKSEWSFDEAKLNAVAVFKLEVESLSCKVHE